MQALKLQAIKETHTHYMKLEVCARFLFYYFKNACPLAFEHMLGKFLFKSLKESAAEIENEVAISFDSELDV